jgi:cytochrome P450
MGQLSIEVFFVLIQTASALTFCIYCMTLYPDVMEQLREEVRKQPGGHVRSNSDLKDLRYSERI